MKERIVSHSKHAKLQYYRHNYCLVCMTGWLGCRWHRYQQSTRDSRKRDLVNFCLLIVAFLFMTVYLYFWLVISNESYTLTVDTYHRVGSYIPWYGLGLGFTSAVFAYITVLMILSLLHVIYGYQLYIHYVHQVICYLVILACLLNVIFIHVYWSHLWPLMYISLQVYGPFLQISAVIIMTCLSALIVRQWYRLSHNVQRIAWTAGYVLGMLFLYLSPLLIDCPLIRSSTPKKPGIVAMGGASSAAPENTEFAFGKALEEEVAGLHTTVQISYDGVPFLLNDNTLDRTTNAKEVFSSNNTLSAMRYTMPQLKLLDAGSWFLEEDPWGTASDLISSDRRKVMQAQIPTLAELLRSVLDGDVKLYLRIKKMPNWHPYHNIDAGKLVSNVTIKSGINVSRVFFPIDDYRPPDASHLLEGYKSVDLKKLGVNATYLDISSDLGPTIRKYRDKKVATIAASVDSAWFLSYVWCLGTNLIVTHYVHEMRNQHEPIFSLNHKSYVILWVVVDVVSAAMIITMAVVQSLEMKGKDKQIPKGIMKMSDSKGKHGSDSGSSASTETETSSEAKPK